MTNILFVCSKNRRRSPTAEDIFTGHPDIEVRSAGLSNDAEEQCSTEDIEWADTIFVMSRNQKQRLSRDFGRYLKQKQLISLDIPDNYNRGDPELTDTLRRRVAAHLPALRPINLAPAKSQRIRKRKLTLR